MREIISIVQSLDRAIISSKNSGKDIKSFIVGIPLPQLAIFLVSGQPLCNLMMFPPVPSDCQEPGLSLPHLARRHQTADQRPGYNNASVNWMFFHQV